ncbi:MAG: DUF4149 domain-containing protein [Bellilinea sp.]
MIENLPGWGLVAAYWLHMLATVLWLGGLATLAFLVIPAARRSLAAADYSSLVDKLTSRLQQIGWFCLMVLIATGMFQMSAHPSYEGFLTIGNAWSLAILSKHLVIGGMIAISVYTTWGLTPELRRLAMLRAAGKPVDETAQQAFLRKEQYLLRINIILSALVLLLTAFARAS